MPTLELDPVFVRALRLLHSKSKDSTAQLQTMLEEAIRHRQGLGPAPSGAPASPQTRREGAPALVMARPEADKRSLDSLKHQLSELSAGPKRARLDSPRSSCAGLSSQSHTPSPTPPGSRGEPEKPSSSDGDEMDMEINLDLEGLNDCTCCICKSFNQEIGNKLMECHTCQNLFHQECHVPSVANEEANDPRLVWNCTECSRTLMPNRPAGKSSPATGSSHKGINVFKGSTSIPSRSSPNRLEYPLKKGDKSPASVKPSLMGPAYHPPTYKITAKALGTASRSSRSSGPSSSSSGKTASGSSSKGGLPPTGAGGGTTGNSGSNNLLHADKRIQMMKKKAAAASRKK